MKRVLVTAIGSFSADAVIQYLKQEGCMVIGCDIYPGEWVANALDVDRFYQAPLASDQEKYLNFLDAICAKEKINYLIPLTDVEVDILNMNRERFEAKEIILCISGENCIRLCRNKYLLYHHLKQYGGIQLISTELLEKQDCEKIDYPVIVKPYDGRSSQGLQYIRNYEEMAYFIEHHDISKYIVQPQIEGSIVTVDVIRDDQHQIKTAVCRRELLRTLNGAGLSVQVFRDERLEREAAQLADYLQIQGCVNFEFICTKEGKYYFLECNPRFSGGVKFSCMAGYNFIVNHLKCFTGEDIESQCNVKEMYIARKYQEIITEVKGRQID